MSDGTCIASDATRVVSEIARVAVVGIGNVLLGDDGFGPSVVAALESAFVVPASVELLDAGTPGLDLAGMLTGRDAVILVDAIEASTAPGTLLVYRDTAVEEMLPRTVRVSPHDPAIAEALSIARLVGDGPHRVALVGAVPERVEVGLGLTDSVHAALGGAQEAVARILDEWGHGLVRRAQDGAARSWWMRDHRGDDAAFASSPAPQ